MGESGGFPEYDPDAPVSEVLDFSLGNPPTPTEAAELTLPEGWRRRHERAEHLERIGQTFGTVVVGMGQGHGTSGIQTRGDLIRQAEITEQTAGMLGRVRAIDGASQYEQPAQPLANRDDLR